MLDARRPEEEGTHTRKTWKAWLLRMKGPIPAGADDVENTCSGAEGTSRGESSVVFRRDGGFARVVAADNVKIVPKRMYLVVRNEEGEPFDDEGKEFIKDQLEKGPNDDSKFTVVYIPPHFRTRVLLFVYLLWITGSLSIGFITCTPREFPLDHSIRNDGQESN